MFEYGHNVQRSLATYAELVSKPVLAQFLRDQEAILGIAVVIRAALGTRDMAKFALDLDAALADIKELRLVRMGAGFAFETNEQLAQAHKIPGFWSVFNAKLGPLINAEDEAIARDE
jgi:hypothetical protein